MGKDEIKIACENRKARHDYFIHETYEAGIELKGTEVKDGEIFIEHLHISPYEQGNIFNHEPLRRRRLLMHKREILKLFGKTREKGFTLVPLKIYFKKGRAKLELALASGKHNYDKRAALHEKSAQREVERALKERSR